MKSGFCGKLLPIGTIVLLAGLCFGQTQTARLQGTVHDASGAIVPNAKVVAVNDATRESSDATANSSGLYVLPALRSGVYTLTVEAAGFSKSVVTGIELAVSANITQDVTLDVGKSPKSVEVAANAVAVTTADAQVSSAVTMNEINNLPQLARQPIALTYFQPGVAISQNGSNAGADYSFSHINGMRQGSNNNTLDGIDVNDAVAPRLGLAMTANNTDSVEEFRVVTEGGKAEYGRNAGGQVELITRSGTNAYHGGVVRIHPQYRRSTPTTSSATRAASPSPCSSRTCSAAASAGPSSTTSSSSSATTRGGARTSRCRATAPFPRIWPRQGIFQWNTSGRHPAVQRPERRPAASAASTPPSPRC